MSCISLYFRIWSSVSPGRFIRYTMHWCGKETFPSGWVRKQWRTPFKDRKVKTRWWHIPINRNYRENTGKGKIFLASVVSSGYTITISTVMIISLMDLQLPVQSMLTTTKVVSTNPAHVEVYSIQHYLIKFVSDLQQVGGFLRVLQFPSSIKLTATI